ncbi:Rhodanese-like domain-containing protein [Mucidula mucida]|nr:Rhodanese-like domain-containing protein [Mucidula mucida]
MARLSTQSKRIPGAQFLDLDGVASSHELGLKHMMPSGSVFADACERFGISPSSSVVLQVVCIYDTHGVFSSPRALFMFRSFGHTNSSILNGGLPLWEHTGLAIESSTPVERERATYPPPQLNTATIRDYNQMVANSALQDGAEIVLDARSRGRFLGTEPEPRPGLSSGHMPNSYSLPFNVFLATQTTPAGASFTVMRPALEIRQALIDAVGEQAVEAIIKGEASVATTCGSGMTAAVLWLGLKLVNAQKVALYDEVSHSMATRTNAFDSFPSVMDRVRDAIDQ